MKKCFFLLFLACISHNIFAADNETCKKSIEIFAKKSVRATKILKCFLVEKLISEKLAGKKQALILYDSEEGISIAIFPTLSVKGVLQIAPKPLFVFPSLGDHADSFENSDGKTTELLIQDLNGDGFKEIGVLVNNQPNSQFFLKTYDSKAKRFHDVTFRLQGIEDNDLTIVVAPGEKLKTPKDLKGSFEVLGEKETRKFLFSKLSD